MNRKVYTRLQTFAINAFVDSNEFSLVFVLKHKKLIIKRRMILYSLYVKIIKKNVVITLFVFIDAIQMLVELAENKNYLLVRDATV